jgi:hypothetical protein
MKIVRRLIYIFFLLIVLIAFVFFGGGRTLIQVGQKMEEMEFAMKDTLGGFCQKGERRIKKKAGKVAGKLTEKVK